MYKALTSFSGVISMRKGEVKAITDKEVVADLLRAGYIEAVKKAEAEKKAEVKTEKKAEEKPAPAKKKASQKKKK
jgi:hypothetical protein